METNMKENVIKAAKRIARRIIGRPIFGKSILIYHRIAKADFDPWNIAVSPEEFEKHLTLLRKSKTVLPLREFAQLNVQRKLPRNAVAITFDDGYACNALVAAPMLKAFGFPATFFIVSDAIARTEEFWWDQLEASFRARGFDYQTATRLLPDRAASGPHLAVRQSDGPLASFLALWRLLRDLPAEQRRRYFAELRNVMGLEIGIRTTHRPMTAPELQTLAANPLFEIGGHTATHPSLPTLTRAEQEREIVASARSLETIIGKPIRSFAYPFGDWAPATRDFVKRVGFDCAVTAEHRRVRRADNQFELPRRQAISRNARALE
jgi:peptidoglycan/xylan/chitin deacetylase (PgdA/CDA1 family)